MQKLDIKSMPLIGRHIIEASAGTGKTYSIIDLYIRLLLEKKLFPNQILIMTFSKDAINDIIIRIESRIKSILDTISKNSRIIITISKKITLINMYDENYNHLKKSLFEIDNASIFTMHSFCKKIINEYAFYIGINMNINIKPNTYNILKKVVENFFRKNINKSYINFNYFRKYRIHTPKKFLANKFLLNLIKSDSKIILDDLRKDYYKLIIEKKEAFNKLKNHESFILNNLVINSKDKIKRINEWNIIKRWCNDGKLTFMPKDLSNFISLKRYLYHVKKLELIDIFKEIKDVKEKYLKIKNLEEYQIKSAEILYIKQSILNIRKYFMKYKEQVGVLDFNDLINTFYFGLKRSPDLINILQDKYPVAIIDECQDIDHKQYDIINIIYPLSNEVINNYINNNYLKYTDQINKLFLVLIGDPKQSIYSFRNTKISTYIKIRNTCSINNQWSIDINWRSTKELIRAYNRLFFTRDYKETDILAKNIFANNIHYYIIKSASINNIKLIDFKDNFKSINYFYYEIKEYDNNKNINRKLSEWTANEIIKLLKSKVVLENDIAILVENSSQAKCIQEALCSKNINLVYLNQKYSVYHTLEAMEILYVMEGINNFENKFFLKKALSTSLFGGTAYSMFSYTKKDSLLLWAKQISKAKELKSIWLKYGFIVFIMKVMNDNFIQRDKYNKNRILTNIFHLFELISMAERKYRYPSQLIRWYRQKLNDNFNDESSELRLENNSNFVKITTIHSAKGLEYSVVFIPFATYVNNKRFMFDEYYSNNLNQIIFKFFKDKTIIRNIEKNVIEELMRLLYVAVTRAKYRCYIGVAKYYNSEKSGLAQFLGYKKNNNWLIQIKKIISNLDNHSVLINISDDNYIKSKKLNKKNKNINTSILKSNSIDVPINDYWDILSFSKISRLKNKNIDLEEYNNYLDYDNIQNLNDKLEFRFKALRGLDIGNILHNVLEHTSFSSGNISNDILQKEVGKYNSFDIDDCIYLKVWLEECLNAPINYITTVDKINDSFCLKDISDSKLLKESEFYFPIINNNLYKSNIIEILEKYRKISKINKQKYIKESFILNSISDNKIFGMLHGFIDLIFEHNGKYYIADYKSNYLGNKLEDYNQETMAKKNESSLYDLQYLIYSVVLNRYLQQNIKNYSYEKYFGGVYYFYLRGMKNGFGVYQAKPSLDIINMLCNLFNGN